MDTKMPLQKPCFPGGSEDGGLAQNGPMPGDTVAKELSSNVTQKSSPSKRGSAGVKGGLYQIDLLTVVMLHALGKLKDWQLSTEDPRMGKFDDIVIESDGEYILIQAKQKEKLSKKITYESLFATSSKAPFSLIHYFLSFNEIKSKFNIKNVIICTNVGIKIENKVATKNKQVISVGIINEHEASTDHILYSKKANNIYYTFKEDFLEELKQHILEDTKVNGQDVKDDDITDFLLKLQIFPNVLPNKKCLETVGKEAISHIPLAKNLDAKSAFKYVDEKVGDWYQAKTFSYLDPVKANLYFCEIISRDFCDSLKEYNVAWECNELHTIFQQPDIGIFHIVSLKSHMFKVIKVFEALENDTSKTTYLFLSQKESIAVQRDVIQVFTKIPQYFFLVVVFPLHGNNELVELLYTVITSSNYKKIIMIAEADNKLADKVKSKVDNFRTYTDNSDNIMFNSLSRSTRENFLKRTVVFQSVPMSFENVMASADGNINSSTDLDFIVESEMLEKLAKKDEEITIWSKVEHLDEDIKDYYIDRKFIREDQHYSEEQLCQRGEEVVLISAMPGMGKSTILDSLAIAVKNNYAHLWVIRVELNNYSNVLKKCSKRESQQILLTELLESQEVTKLKNEFERRLFQVKDKVVLMVDAVDEISPNYFDIVTHLLADCNKDHNIDRIFITTRPHVCQNLENKLGVKAYKLVPYSEIDQVNFLTGYWIKHLGLQEQMLKEKCRNFANLLMQKMSMWIHDRNCVFTGIPLQMRMMAELFQKNNEESSDELAAWNGCREFLSAEKVEISLPDKFNLFELYTKFIYKKRIVFIEDKGKSRGNVIVEDSLTGTFNKCHEFHCVLAMQVILPPDEEELSTLYRTKQEVLSSAQDYSLKVGIVQQINGELHFIHRTFAEYYVAECLLSELLQETHNEQLMEFFLTKILLDEQYYIIRLFLDDFIKVKLSSLLDVAQNLHRYVVDKFGSIAHIKSEFQLSTPIHIAAEDGCLYLMKLLIGQLVESKALRRDRLALVDDADWIVARDKTGSVALHYAVSNDHLNIVKFLVAQYAGSNWTDPKNEEGLTVVHCAVKRGNLEVIHYLLQQLDNWFDIKDGKGLKVLHYAAFVNNVPVLEFLVEQLAGTRWCDIKDNEGRTALHYVNNLRVLEFLMEKLDTNWANIRDNKSLTLLHYAAFGGNFTIVEFLMGQLAAAGTNWIEIRDNEGRTVLHYATKGGNMQVVEFLIKQLTDNWLDIRDNQGFTALHSASTSRVIKFLMDKGGINDWINIKSSKGLTVLHCAAADGYVFVVKFLINKLANVNWTDIKNDNGLTALHYAAKGGNLHVIKCLLSRMPNSATNWTNIKDEDDSTALHIAAQEDNLRVVYFLLRQLKELFHNSLNSIKPLTIKGGDGKSKKFEFKEVHALLDVLDEIKNILKNRDGTVDSDYVDESDLDEIYDDETNLLNLIDLTLMECYDKGSEYGGSTSDRSSSAYESDNICYDGGDDDSTCYDTDEEWWVVNNERSVFQQLFYVNDC